MNLVFVCGALRSGTSLLHLILDAHPKIGNPGEFDFLFDGLIEAGEDPQVELYAEFLRKNRIFNTKSLTIDTSIMNCSQLIQNLINQLDNPGILSLNIHRNFDFAQSYFPDAKFLHLIRDPRDVALSTIRMGWAGNTYYAADHWIAAEESWEKLAINADSINLCELKFENLVSDPKTTLNALCDFLGTEYQPEMLHYYKGSTYGPPDISLIEQWKNLDSPREIELVEFKAKKLIQARGYGLSCDAHQPPGFYERLLLFFSNRAYRYRFSIRRYGLLLSLGRKITTVWPMLPGADYFRKRIHRIQMWHLK